jgi:hypothetical protein
MNLTHSLPHLGGQTQSRIQTPDAAEAIESTEFPENQPTKAELTQHNIRYLFAIFVSVMRAQNTLDLQAFSLP